MNAVMSPPPIDLNDPAFLAGDRSAAYARLRAEHPVWRLAQADGSDAWVVSRYADVQAILRMRGGRVQPLGEDAPAWIGASPTRERLRANLAQADAPVHQRLRAVVGPMFVPRRTEELRAMSANSAAGALQQLAIRGSEFDAVHEIAAQVPKGVICHLLGIPQDDWAELIAVQQDFLLIFSLFPLTDEQTARLDAVVRFYQAYFERILERTPAGQHSEFVRLLLAGEARGELTRVETLSLMHTVLDAGYETTRTSISNAIELLATVPGLFDTIRAHPELIETAVEEILRVRTPVHVRHRFLVEAYTASDGSVIPAGAQALLLLGSANLDEAVFDEPQHVDVRRANASRQVSFGAGIHHCLGAPLARLQLQETLRGLVAAYRRIELGAGPAHRHASLKFPSLASLRITVS